MKEVETRLSMTRIDEQKMENIEEGKILMIFRLE